MLPSRSHWLAAAFLTSAVVVGGAAGWLLKGWTAGRARQDRDPNTTIAYLTTQLGLTGDQQDSIRTILELRRMKMDSIWRQTRPGIDSLRAVMQVEIEEELTPAQRVALPRADGVARHVSVTPPTAPVRHRGTGTKIGFLNWIDKCQEYAPGDAGRRVRVCGPLGPQWRHLKNAIASPAPPWSLRCCPRSRRPSRWS